MGLEARGAGRGSRGRARRYYVVVEDEPLAQEAQGASWQMSAKVENTAKSAFFETEKQHPADEIKGRWLDRVC